MSSRIIIADDHPLFRAGLRHLIEKQVTAQIVEVSDSKALHAQAAIDPPPDVMFLDLVFPGFEGEASVASLRAKYPCCALVIVSMSDSSGIVSQMMAAGANGFISKTTSPLKMKDCIAQVLRGELAVCVDGEGEPYLELDCDLSKMTPRQREVLVQIGCGKTTKEIARELRISPFTVRTHISSLLKLLGVSSLI